MGMGQLGPKSQHTCSGIRLVMPNGNISRVFRLFGNHRAFVLTLGAPKLFPRQFSCRCVLNHLRKYLPFQV